MWEWPGIFQAGQEGLEKLYSRPLGGSVAPAKLENMTYETTFQRKAEIVRDTYYAEVMRQLTERVIQIEGTLPDPDALELHGHCQQSADGQTAWFWKGELVLTASGPRQVDDRDGGHTTLWSIRQVAPTPARQTTPLAPLPLQTTPPLRVRVVRSGEWGNIQTGYTPPHPGGELFRVRLDSGGIELLTEQEFSRMATPLWPY